MKKILKILGKTILVFFLISMLWVLFLKFCPVYFTPVMAKNSVQQLFSGRSMKIYHEWVSLEKISLQMAIAVVASEDNLFFKHHGISYSALKKVVQERKKGKRYRGGSTISQQTAKNVFTFGTRTWMRKGFETYFTCLIEFFWSKKRIMEVYLNSIEFGESVFGVEAASQRFFNISAKKLSRDQAALLAAVLPNPKYYNAQKPGAYICKRQSQIVSLMPKMARIDFLCPPKVRR
jgi:monofunctional biosynthetic peptidoglycan transglycosylase